ELVAEELRAEAELPERLADVSVREVRAHERAVRAFAQRLAGEREQPGVERLAEPALAGEAFAERIEGVQPQLAPPLALELGPLLVPVRQHVADEQRRVDLRFVPRRPVHLA